MLLPFITACTFSHLPSKCGKANFAISSYTILLFVLTVRFNRQSFVFCPSLYCVFAYVPEVRDQTVRQHDAGRLQGELAESLTNQYSGNSYTLH